MFRKERMQRPCFDQELRQRSSCYKELEKYLKASFECSNGEINHYFLFVFCFSFILDVGFSCQR